MLVIIGTVPDTSFPLVSAQVTLQGDQLVMQRHSVPVHRGTPALIGAAAQVAMATGQPAPHAILVGDTGLGHGSRNLYAYLTDHIQELEATTIVFHYLQPDVDWHNRVLMALEECIHRPRLIADAGFMYAAKMSGFASSYDLFTPDMGELAFLADETAPHPFYTRGFILHDNNKAPDLITRAYTHDNAARHLLVKGATDMFATKKGVHWTIDSPSTQAMEAIGGTGDTLTGMASFFIDEEASIEEACKKAASANRWAGELTQPTPATQVMEIIQNIPKALEKI
ncbi:MAG: NAD(P)H-hydrate dehydratase [Desulfoplanes sp.]|nr:NAD(P)H-hydrate dehydratase [Desulfoplanes sp.]